MMKRTATLVALVAVVLVASNASAQTNNHFDRQRREAVSRQAAAQDHFSHSRSFNAPYRSGHWGGPTTAHRYYQPSHGHFHRQNVQFYPVSPFGFGVPNYGFYGGISPYNYYSPFGFPGGSSVYIHREIYLSR